MIRRLLIAGLFGLGATLNTSAQVIPFFGHLPMVPFSQSVNVTPPPTPTATTCSLSLQLTLCVGGSN